MVNQNNENSEIIIKGENHEYDNFTLEDASPKKSIRNLWIFLSALITIAIAFGVFFYFNFSRTKADNNNSTFVKQPESSDDGISVVKLGKEIRVEKDDVFQIPNKELKIKILGFKPDMTMGWGGGPHVKFVYNILNEEGEYEGDIAETPFLLKLDNYRITIIESNWESYAKMKIEENYKKAEDCDWLPEGDLRDKCYIDVVKNTLDLNDCYKIQNGNIWFGCILALAPLTKDSSLCDKLEDMPMRYRCYSSVAATAIDKEICDKTETIPYFKKNECYQQVAVSANDSSYCSYLENQDENNQCLSYLAKETENFEHCQNVSELKLKDRCYRDVHHKTMDIEICGYIEDLKERDYCYLFGAPFKAGDSKNCDLIHDHPDGQDRCYDELAAISQNADYCEKVNSERLKRYCVSKASCETVSSIPQRDQCYLNIINSTFYTDLCNMLSDKTKADDCYLKHGKCDNISDIQKRKDCLNII